MLKVSVLTIGDEICIGQIINTNVAWISKHCSRLGCQIIAHSSIEDERSIILSELNRLISISDIIIVTGGLGPTHDDITKPVLTEFFKDKLVLHEESLAHIEKLLSNRGIQMTERNHYQAVLPSKCKPLSNPIGTAPGMMFEKDNKLCFSLPGVPNEMKAIMETHILPFIADLIEKNNHSVFLYRTIHTIGIAESTLADLIGEPNTFIKNGTLAFLPTYKGVKLRIGIIEDNFVNANIELEKARKHIYSKAAAYIFGENDDTINLAVSKLMILHQKTLSVAESCTGGLLGSYITEIPGSSSFFQGGLITYSNEAKINLLGVKKDTINEFGAVSMQTAQEMAIKIKNKFATDYGISITGIAGPDGASPQKPVGTVWIGLADKYSCETHNYQFSKDRIINRERAVGTALALLYNKLKALRT